MAKRPEHRGSIVAIIRATAVVVALLHLWQTATYAISSGQFKNLHLGLSLFLVCLALGAESAGRWRKRALWLLAMLALVPLAYVHLEFDALVSERMFEPSAADAAIAVLLIGTTLIAVSLQWGPTIPIIALAALSYAYFGAYMPGALLFHPGVDLSRLLAYASIPYFQGTLGSLTGMSASIVFIFMLFSGVLKAAGGIDLILSAARAIGGRSKAGPAHVAVLSSGFMGMVSGSTVANVASTGSMTIPMMKRFGFRAEHAAAIEAVASTGGQFAPPVMGLTAFLIVGMTGIPYSEIMLAAVLPALVYYVYLLGAVSLQYGSDACSGAPEEQNPDDRDGSPGFRRLLREHGHLMLGIGVLVYLLVIQLPPAFAAAGALATIAATETVKQIVISRARPLVGLANATRTLVRGLEDGALSGAQLAIVIAAIGIFVDVVVTTGFAQKISYLMLDVASDTLWLLLGMTAAASLLFGLGMPTPAAYILVALLGVPALERVGVPRLAAHMFVFYFANMSAITPPVAVAALVAAKLAGAKYFATAFAACRFGLAGFTLPFLFVYAPAILLLQGGALQGALTSAGALVALLALNCALTGFLAGAMSILQRLLMALAAASILWFEPIISLAGACVATAVVALQLLRNREK